MRAKPYVGAVLIWVPVQILECLWLIIGLETTAQKNAIDLSNQLTDTDTTTTKKNPRSRRASKKLAGIPFFFVGWASLMALAAYAFDLVIGLRTYPLWKDWNTFMLWAKSFNPMWLNTQNAIDLPDEKIDQIEDLADDAIKATLTSSAIPLLLGIGVGGGVAALSGMPIVGVLGDFQQ